MWLIRVHAGAWYYQVESNLRTLGTRTALAYSFFILQAVARRDAFERETI